MQFQVIMDHRGPLRDITNHPDGRRGLKRPKAQTDTTLPDDHDHGKIQVYLFAAKPHDMLSLFMMQVSFRILLETWRGFAAPSGELSLWFTMGQYTISQHFGCE